MRASSRFARLASFLPRSLMFTLAAAALAAVVLPAGCTSDGGNSRHGMFGGANKSLAGVNAQTPVVTWADANNAGLSIRWQKAIGLALSRGEAIDNFWRVKDRLYIVTNQGQLHAIDAKTGTAVWAAPADLGTTELNLFRPADADDDGKSLIVVNRTEAWTLDRKTGTIIRRGGFRFAAAADPVVIGNTVLIGSGAEYFHAVYADYTDQERWNIRSNNDSFVSAPVVSVGKNVMVASHNGFIWSLNGTDGKPLWCRQAGGGQVEAPLASDGQRLYVPALNNKLYAFDELTGNHLWDARLDGRLNQPAQPAGPAVLIVGSGQGLYAITADKGDRKWLTPGIRQLISHSATQAFAADGAGQLKILDLETGAVTQTVPVSYPQAYAINPVSATIFIVTRDGRVAALEPATK